MSRRADRWIKALLLGAALFLPAAREAKAWWSTPEYFRLIYAMPAVVPYSEGKTHHYIDFLVRVDNRNSLPPHEPVSIWYRPYTNATAFIFGGWSSMALDLLGVFNPTPQYSYAGYSSFSGRLESRSAATFFMKLLGSHTDLVDLGPNGAGFNVCASRDPGIVEGGVGLIQAKLLVSGKGLIKTYGIEGTIAVQNPDPGKHVGVTIGKGGDWNYRGYGGYTNYPAAFQLSMAPQGAGNIEVWKISVPAIASGLSAPRLNFGVYCVDGTTAVKRTTLLPADRYDSNFGRGYVMDKNLTVLK